MASTTDRRWHDTACVALGVWLFFSPWILGFRSEMPDTSWNFFVIGVAFAAVAAADFGLNWLWGEWLNLALGIWMILAPWLLFYNDHPIATADSIIVGAIVTVLSIWMLGARLGRGGSAPAKRTLSR